MNTKDLMLLDWVMFDDKPNQVTALSCNHIEVNSNQTTKDTILPIGLTEGILEGNGFYHNLPYKITDDICLVTWIYTKMECCSFVIVYDASARIYNWNGYEVNYVHQLQHALRISGFEELADKFKVNI